MTEPNAVQRADWNGDSGALWVADADRRDRILAPVLDAVISAARLEPHEDVLDIGCGCGATTLAAARLLDTGTATGIDISQPMLELARNRARHDTGVGFVEGDAQIHNFDVTYDVAISRFGTMFFDDPVIAFRQIRVLSANLADSAWRRGNPSPRTNGCWSQAPSFSPTPRCRQQTRRVPECSLNQTRPRSGRCLRPQAGVESRSNRAKLHFASAPIPPTPWTTSQAPD